VRIQRHPEFAPTGRRRAEIHQNQRNQMLAQDIEKLDRSARRTDIVARETQLREQGNRDSIITLEQHHKRSGGRTGFLIECGSGNVEICHLLFSLLLGCGGHAIVILTGG
jgi:hypothetical protein